MPQSTANKRGPWPIRVIALLLILQAVGLVGLNAYNINTQLGDQAKFKIDFDDINTPDQYDNLPADQRAIVDALLTGIFLVPMAIVAVIASIGFLFLQRFGWLLAMLTQVIILIACLVLYLGIRPTIIYPIMLYSVLMVLYLNIHEVRIAFHQPRPKQQTT